MTAPELVRQLGQLRGDVAWVVAPACLPHLLVEAHAGDYRAACWVHPSYLAPLEALAADLADRALARQAQGGGWPQYRLRAPGEPVRAR